MCTRVAQPLVDDEQDPKPKHPSLRWLSPPNPGLSYLKPLLPPCPTSTSPLVKNLRPLPHLPWPSHCEYRPGSGLTHEPLSRDAHSPAVNTSLGKPAMCQPLSRCARVAQPLTDDTPAYAGPPNQPWTQSRPPASPYRHRHRPPPPPSLVPPSPTATARHHHCRRPPSMAAARRHLRPRPASLLPATALRHRPCPAPATRPLPPLTRGALQTTRSARPPTHLGRGPMHSTRRTDPGRPPAATTDLQRPPPSEYPWT